MAGINGYGRSYPIYLKNQTRNNVPKDEKREVIGRDSNGREIVIEQNGDTYRIRKDFSA